VAEALKKPELTPREVAWHITGSQGAFISESSVYRILRGYDLVGSPAYIVLTAAQEAPQPGAEALNKEIIRPEVYRECVH